MRTDGNANERAQRDIWYQEYRYIAVCILYIRVHVGLFRSLPAILLPAHLHSFIRDLYGTACPQPRAFVRRPRDVAQHTDEQAPMAAPS